MRRSARGNRPSKFTVNASSWQADGLVAWWPFADANGWIDKISNQWLGFPGPALLSTNNGLGSQTSVTPPPIHSALAGGSVNTGAGNGLYVQNPVAALTAPTALTVFARVCPNPTNYVGNSTPLGNWNGFGWLLYLGTDPGNVYGYVNGTGIQGTSIVQKGAWQDIGYTWDGTTITVYYNGLPENSGAASSLVTPAVPVEMLNYNNSGAGASLAGGVADVRFYQRALSSAEMWALTAPATRWDLYQPQSSRVFFVTGAAAVPPAVSAYLRPNHLRPRIFAPGRAR
jgi:hypothetical protein